MALILLVPISSYAETISAEQDYIEDCEFATCVGLAAMRWSKEHPYGVSVAVSMGQKAVVTDNQIKQVLIHDLEKNGIKEFRFFYENHEAAACAMTLHVRGGTEGPFLIDDVRQNIPLVAERAKMKEPVYLPSSSD